MLTFVEAWGKILNEVQPLQPIDVPLLDALGHVLAVPAIADADSPRFDKSLMDGYAVLHADLLNSVKDFEIIEEVLAGMVPQRPIKSGEATRIMTGAPVPVAADVVIPVELTQVDPTRPNRVQINVAQFAKGKNILRRGESTKQGAEIISQGQLIRAVEVGCMAEMGQSIVRVVRRPRVAVLATGDELVEVAEQPGPGQIRNSNEAMLVAQLRQAGFQVTPLGIARDNLNDLREKIELGMQSDVLVLSGGVSAGKVDLVPQVLSACGVTEVFHKVKIRPGQPLWFGRFERKHALTQIPGNSNSVTTSEKGFVFGLPGNPVSSLVCCELFVKTALRQLSGHKTPQPQTMPAKLKRDVPNIGTRPTFHPARLTISQDGSDDLVETVRWVGSADLCATAAANALIAFTEPDREYRAGECVPVYPL